MARFLSSDAFADQTARPAPGGPAASVGLGSVATVFTL